MADKKFQNVNVCVSFKDASQIEPGFVTAGVVTSLNDDMVVEFGAGRERALAFALMKYAKKLLEEHPRVFT